MDSDVKIGDFGLAVNQSSMEDNSIQLVENLIEEPEFTSGVGTSLYIAPETMLRKKLDRNVKYSNKIDSEFIFSFSSFFFCGEERSDEVFSVCFRNS